MEAEFRSRFGCAPVWEVKCPGRVNLIGEHIDYHGYSVLPMALEVHTKLLIAPLKESVIRMENVNTSFSSRSEAVPSEWNGATPPQWTDYLLAGWRGAIDTLKLPQQGFALLLDSTVPAAAGLSSSSSLVCAAALATVVVATEGHPWEKIDKSQLADLCTTAERLIGTAGGGMDQAAECLAEDGSALVISFNPLRTRKVQLPEGAAFVVADSMERKNKAASNEYNTRVVEGRIAVALLGRSLGLSDWKTLRRLKEVEDKSGLPLEQLVQHVESLPNQLSIDEARSSLGDHLDVLLTQDTKTLTSFIIRSRARHVYSEALRVSQFADACAEGNLTEMGRLMDDSHHSCSVDYDCSSPLLDRLVVSLKQFGALGARLTGAGWGGCAVALLDGGMGEGKGERPPILFQSKPSQGIQVRSLLE